MSEKTNDPLDLTPILARLEKTDISHADPETLLGELTDWDPDVAALFAFAPSNIRALLAEVSRLRAALARETANLNETHAAWNRENEQRHDAQERVEQLEARLAAIAALPEQWRRVANAVPAADEDYGRGLDDARIACASEVAALLQGQEPQK